MVTKLKYSEEGFTIVADDTADLLKVFDHVMEGPQVVEVRNVANVEGPSPWADERVRELVKQGTREALKMNMPETFADDAPVSVGPLIGEELNTGEVVGAIVSHADGTETVNNVPEWIIWNPALYDGYGGPSGIEEGTELTVRDRKCDEYAMQFGENPGYWQNDNSDVDFIAYRIES